MQSLKFATVTMQWTDRNGTFHPAMVTFSDAATIREHTDAIALYDSEMPTGGVSVTRVVGFKTFQDAARYCKENGFLIV